LKKLDEIIKDIMENNDWLNGVYDFKDGDLMALVNQPEKFKEVTEISDLGKLYENLRNYDGVFKYKNLLFFNDWRYGTFVYDINVEDRSHYVEHLSIDAMSFKSFYDTIQRLLRVES